MPEPRRIAFVFPGVGMPLCGREVEFADRHARLIWQRVEAASQRVGLDLERALRLEQTLRLPTVGQQALAYAFSVGSAEVFGQRVGLASAVAGYSFGIYAALTVAEVWRFEDGLAALLEAERIMETLLPKEPCGLCVVLGLDAQVLAQSLRGSNELAVVNRNTEQCFVIAGPKAALEDACGAALSHGAFTARLLPVSVPYHHPLLLKDARGLFAAWLETLSLRAPAVPVISSLDGELQTSAAGIAQYAAANLASPLDWLSCLLTIDRLGIELVLECGLGLSLSQNARFAPLLAEHGNLRNFARFNAS